MAYAPFHLLCLLVLFFLNFALSQNNNDLSVGSSLTATDSAKPWLSPSGDFAFGFQQMQGDKDQFLLSIWYNNIPDITIVWYVNDGKTVLEGSKVELTSDRGLVLTDVQGKELWSSGPVQTQNEVSSATLNDTGNFMIFNMDSTKLWDSFGNPTDTLLPTQILETNGKLYSRFTESNFSKGRFQLQFLDGNLVLNTRDIVTNNAYYPYYQISDRNKSNQDYQVKFSATGYISIIGRDGAVVNLTTNKSVPAAGYYHRATLNYDGVLVQYYHPKDFNGTSNWTAVWQIPDNICLDQEIIGAGGSGACGYNSVCRPDDSRRAHCACPDSYSLLDPNDKHGSCKPNFTQSCDDNGSSSEDLYGFVEIANTDWPTSDYEQLKPISELDCKKQCLNDCYCTVAIYLGDSCWKNKLPLSYGTNDMSVNSKAFLKFSKSDHPQAQDGPTHQRKKNKDTLILRLVSVLLGSSVFVNLLLLTVVVCSGIFYIYPKRTIIPQPANNSVETNVRCFTNNELVEATNGFKEELGRGAFGIVYKGVIQMSSTVTVAVKKIDQLVQDGTITKPISKLYIKSS